VAKDEVTDPAGVFNLGADHFFAGGDDLLTDEFAFSFFLDEDRIVVTAGAWRPPRFSASDRQQFIGAFGLHAAQDTPNALRMGIVERSGQSHLDKGLPTDADACGFLIDPVQEIDGEIDIDTLLLAPRLTHFVPIQILIDFV
jgi:hypothetical protein